MDKRGEKMFRKYQEIRNPLTGEIRGYYAEQFNWEKGLIQILIGRCIDSSWSLQIRYKYNTYKYGPYKYLSTAKDAVVELGF